MREGIKDEFSRNGYVILEDFFSEEEVAELREAGEKLTENLPEESKRVIFSTTKTQQNKNKYFLDSADKISFFFEEGALDDNGKLLVEPSIALNKVGHALHWLNPTFKKYTFCEKVKETCFQLGMADPVIVQSMYIYKNPGLGGEVVPHQDSTYLYTEPQQLVGFWIALDDATIENGCLNFAPGSHKGGVHRRMIRNPDPNAEELFIFTAPSPFYPTSNFRATPVKKGTCVLIHGEVVHKSAPNKSPHPRHAYTFHVVDLKNSTYAPENWLQLPSGQNFAGVYKN